jgi:hypothetical protein
LYELHKALLPLSQKAIHLKIIWFYLVRAEVVLWWHCLIFFIAGAKQHRSGNIFWGQPFAGEK